MTDFIGHTVLVTGAAAGIGFGIGAAFTPPAAASRSATCALGPVTIAVANAGIFPNCPVLEMTQEEWERVIETNMRGVFLTWQAAARRMVAAHYCASKAGVVMFTKVLAMELGPHHINVNCTSASDSSRRRRNAPSDCA